MTSGNREAEPRVVWVAILDRQDMTERQKDRSGIETKGTGETCYCEGAFGRGWRQTRDRQQHMRSILHFSKWEATDTQEVQYRWR